MTSPFLSYSVLAGDITEDHRRLHLQLALKSLAYFLVDNMMINSLCSKLGHKFSSSKNSMPIKIHQFFSQCALHVHKNKDRIMSILNCVISLLEYRYIVINLSNFKFHYIKYSTYFHVCYLGSVTIVTLDSISLHPEGQEALPKLLTKLFEQVFPPSLRKLRRTQNRPLRLAVKS